MCFRYYNVRIPDKNNDDYFSYSVAGSSKFFNEIQQNINIFEVYEGKTFRFQVLQELITEYKLVFTEFVSE